MKGFRYQARSVSFPQLSLLEGPFVPRPTILTPGASLGIECSEVQGSTWAPGQFEVPRGTEVPTYLTSLEEEPSAHNLEDIVGPQAQELPLLLEIGGQVLRTDNRGVPFREPLRHLDIDATVGSRLGHFQDAWSAAPYFHRKLVLKGLR